MAEECCGLHRMPDLQKRVRDLEAERREDEIHAKFSPARPTKSDAVLRLAARKTKWALVRGQARGHDCRDVFVRVSRHPRNLEASIGSRNSTRIAPGMNDRELFP